MYESSSKQNKKKEQKNKLFKNSPNDIDKASALTEPGKNFRSGVVNDNEEGSGPNNEKVKRSNFPNWMAVVPIKVRKPHEMIEENSRQIHKTRNQSNLGKFQVESEMQSQNQERKKEAPKGQAIEQNEPNMDNSQGLNRIKLNKHLVINGRPCT